MPLVPIPIGKGVYANVDSTSVKTPEAATVLKNLVIDDAGANIDRPALSSTPFGQTGAASGIIGAQYFPVSDTTVLVDIARRIWSMDSSGVTTDITGASILGGTGRPMFASDGTYLAIAGGGAPQRWSGTGTTEIMPGSPPDTDDISYLDGYWIARVLNSPEFRYAGPTPVARETWSSGDFFEAEGLPDNVVTQAVLIRELYAFGNESTEIFQNFGASQPFSRTFFIDTGISAARSVVKWDNSLGWLDDEKKIVRMEGRTPVHISAPIQSVLDGYDTVDDCWAANIRVGGYYFAVWVFPTAETAWAMNQKTREWSEWDGFTGPNQQRFPMHAHAYVKEWSKNLVGDPYTGVVRELSFDHKVDGSQVLRRLRRMRYTHGSGQRKRSNFYLFDVKRGVGTSGGVEPVFEIRVNDDGKGWSNWKQVPLGLPGTTQSPTRVRMGGIYRERQLEIQATEPYAFSLVSIQESIDSIES